jgi:diamine N-acetyltransferase
MAKKTASTIPIRYIQGNQNLLGEIKVLWEALNQYHCIRSAHFKEHYLGMTFEKRKTVLLKKAAGGELHVELAVDEVTGQSAGYLVCSLGGDATGEIESIYVEEAYRGRGVGDGLMKNALAWMEQKGAVEKVVEVSVGNEYAWGFYGRFGFLPRKTLLQQAKKR